MVKEEEKQIEHFHFVCSWVDQSSVCLFILFLVKLPVLFLDFFKGEIAGGNSELVSHHFSNVFGEKFCIGDLLRTRMVNGKIFEFRSLKQLSHRQPDDRLGSVRLLPGPVYEKQLLLKTVLYFKIENSLYKMYKSWIFNCIFLVVVNTFLSLL